MSKLQQPPWWRRQVWILPGIAAFLMTLQLVGDAAGPTRPRSEAFWYPAPGNNGWALVYLAALGASLWLRRFRHARPRIHVIEWAAAIVGLTVLLATAAYLPYLGDRSFVSLILWILQLFTGGVDPAAVLPEPNPLALQIARTLALGTLFVTALAAAARLSRVALDRWWVDRAAELDVVTGLAPDTLPLVRALMDEVTSTPRLPEWCVPTSLERLAATFRREPGVVVILPNPDDPMLGEVRVLGARVLVGEASDPALLSRAVVTRGHICVRRLFAVSATQSQNVAVVKAAGAIIEAHTAERGWLASAKVPRLIARFDDPREARDWRLGHIGAKGRFVDAVSRDELTARSLVDRMIQAACTVALLVGETALTVALLDEIALRRAFSHELSDATPGGRSNGRLRVNRVIVAGERSQLTVDEWSRHRPPAANVPTPLVVEATADDWEAAARDLCGPGVVGAVVVAEPASEKVTARAIRLGRSLAEGVVFFPAAGEEGVEPLDPDRTVRPSDRLVHFGSTILEDGAVPQDSWTLLARQQHDVYIAPLEKNGTAARRGWGEAGEEQASRLPDFFREDNLRQQRGVLMSIEAIAATVTNGPAWEVVTAAEPPRTLRNLDLLEVARREHERWCALREQQGWTLALPHERGDRLGLERARRNGNLVRWEDGGPRRPGRGTDAELPGPEALWDWNAALVATLIRRLHWWGIAPAKALTTHGPQRYRRVGEVTATRLREPLEWEASGGERVRGLAGDWLVDPDAERRTVAAAEFPLLYAPTGQPDRYSRIGAVWAQQAQQTSHVETLEGRVTAHPGDWIVTDDRGRSWPVPDTQFLRTHAPDFSPNQTQGNPPS